MAHEALTLNPSPPTPSLAAHLPPLINSGRASVRIPPADLVLCALALEPLQQLHVPPHALWEQNRDPNAISGIPHPGTPMCRRPAADQRFLTVPGRGADPGSILIGLGQFAS